MNRLLIITGQFLFVGMATWAIQGDWTFAIAVSLCTTASALVLVRHTSSLHDTLLQIGILDYLFFNHAALRVRDFADITADTQVLVRIVCGTFILLVGGLKLVTQSRGWLSVGENCILLFCLYLIVCSTIAVLPSYAAACGFLYLALCVAISAAARSIGPEQTFRTIGLAMAALLFASLAATLIEPEIGWIRDYAGGLSVARYKGIFVHPIQLGNGLSILATYAGYRMTQGPLAGSRLRMGGLAILIALSMLLMALAQSRVGIATTLASLAYIFLFYHRKPALFGALMVVSVVGLLIPLVDFSAFTRSGNVGELLTLTNRTGVWAYATRFISAAPWLGYGYGATRDLFGSASDTLGWTAAHAHNFILQGLLEVGVVGLVIISIPLGRLGFACFRFENVIAGIAFIQIFLRSTTEVVLFYYAPGAMTAMLALALAAVALQKRRRRNGNSAIVAISLGKHVGTALAID